MSRVIRIDKEVKELIDQRRAEMKASGMKKVTRSDALRDLLLPAPAPDPWVATTITSPVDVSQAEMTREY